MTILQKITEADPYCIIKCEGEKVRSEVVKNSNSPTWNASAVFYRKNPNKPIKVQVWNNNMVVDSFMGQTIMMAKSGTPATDGRPTLYTEHLYGRRSKKTEMMKGTVAVEIESHEDLEAL